jgi:peptidoglycan/LPS O-acetylase OafA/YrhL
MALGRSAIRAVTASDTSYASLAPIARDRAVSVYRADIDGLRAVAVLLVVGFHAFPHFVPGGFIGVDVFFLISGYLITGIIVDAQREGVFSFRQFYTRRIRRIFPALITVLIATYIAAWYFLLPDELISLGRNIFGGAAFVSNIVLLNEVNYFDFAARDKPLLHLWSLGVEEQFYICWPLVAWLTYLGRHRRRQRLMIVGVLLCLISCVSCIVLSYSHPAFAFFSPITRFWEILCGAVLVTLSKQPVALTTLNTSRVPHLRFPILARYTNKGATLAALADFRSAIGIALIVIAAVGFRHRDVFPGWRALVPVFGSVLLISTQYSWVNRSLSHPVFVYIGLVSYPFYLWHWPLLCFAKHIRPGSAGLVTAAVVLSFGLACATYHVIEKPLRFGKPRAGAAFALCPVMTAIGSLGLVAVWQGGFDFRVPSEVRNFAHVSVDEESEWRLHRCLLEAGDDSSHFSNGCVDQSRRPLVFLWGDSLAAALYPGLRDDQAVLGYGLAQFTIAGCPPVLGFALAERPNCRGNNEFVAAAISKYAPEIVLLHSFWRYDGLNLDRVEPTIADIRRRASARIVILGLPPTWEESLPHNVIRYYWNTGSLIPRYSRFMLINGAPAETVLRQRAKSWGVEYLSAWDALCNADGCRTRVGDTPDDLVTFDGLHLTPKGAKFLADRIMPAVLGR